MVWVKSDFFLDDGGSCVCGPGDGYDGGLDACVACALGKYKDDVSKTSCSDCPDIMETVGLRGWQHGKSFGRAPRKAGFRHWRN